MNFVVFVKSNGQFEPRPGFIFGRTAGKEFLHDDSFAIHVVSEQGVAPIAALGDEGRTESLGFCMI